MTSWKRVGSLIVLCILLQHPIGCDPSQAGGESAPEAVVQTTESTQESRQEPTPDASQPRPEPQPDTPSRQDTPDQKPPSPDSSQVSWKCDNPSNGTPTPPSSPMFVEVTDKAGVGGALTRGFGRVMVVDIDGDGFDDIVGTPAHDGKHPTPPQTFDKVVLRNNGDGTFRDFTKESGLDKAQVGLLLFADVDNDGDVDAYAGVIEGKGLDAQGIWLNDGKGKFTRKADSGITVEQLKCGSNTCTAAQISGTFADFDGDGILDLYLTGWFWSDGKSDTRYNPPPKDRIYKGKGDGSFVDLSDNLGNQSHPRTGSSAKLGRAGMGTAAGDYDNDGDIDIFVANYGAGRPKGPFSDRVLCQPPRYWDHNLLWKNDGQMKWRNVAEQAGVHATLRGPLGILKEDPLILGNECKEDVRGSYPSPIGGNHFTPQFADFDNDGDLDLIVGSIAHPDYVQSDPTLLLVNQGAPDYTFKEEAKARGLLYREDEKHPSFVDIDNDGRLDLTVTGFRNTKENFLYVYLQNDKKSFVKQSNDKTGVADQHQETAIWIDYDNDGDLDLYIAKDEGSGRLFENRAADRNNHLVIRLIGTQPKDATGARVTLTSTTGTQLREVTSGNGHYNVQRSKSQYFGLGGDNCARDVTIRWPDGSRQKLGHVKANVSLLVTKDGEIKVLRERN